MAKNKELSKSDKLYIENNFNKLSEKELSRDVNVVISEVRKYIESLVVEVVEEDEKPNNSVPTVDDLMGKDKGGKYGYSIMTPAASERADETRKKGKKLIEGITVPCKKK